MNESEIIMLSSGLLAGALGGTLAGLLAGLAGIGGGLIYVPVFYACLPHDAADASLSVFISLLAIVLTGGFSTRAHYRLGNLDRPAATRLLPGLMIGAALGLLLTLHLPEAVILAAMALLDAWVAWDYGRPIDARGKGISLGLASGPIGYISGALGIGGGTMLVPLLRRTLPLRKAVGTSSLCGTLMACAALIANGLFVPAWQPLLASRWWFILGVSLTVLLVLPFATRTSARLHAVFGEEELRLWLKVVFATLAVVMALAGVHQYLTSR
jgi:uncharacterized protein